MSRAAHVQYRFFHITLMIHGYISSYNAWYCAPPSRFSCCKNKLNSWSYSNQSRLQVCCWHHYFMLLEEMCLFSSYILSQRWYEMEEVIKMSGSRQRDDMPLHMTENIGKSCQNAIPTLKAVLEHMTWISYFLSRKDHFEQSPYSYFQSSSKTITFGQIETCITLR